LPTTSNRSFIIGSVAVPSLLICVLSFALYRQFLRPVAVPRPPSELYSDLALGVSVGLACVCWGQLFVLSKAHVSDLETLETQLQRHEDQELSQAAEALQRYAIFMLDSKGYVASWDRDAERLLGYTTGEAISRHISLFYSEADARQGKPAHDLMTATTEGRSDDERWMVRKDGFRFKSSVAIVAIRDPTGNLCGFTNVIREEGKDSVES
jgi:PAS domain S-box-containing protein